MRIFRVEHLGNGLGPYIAPRESPESIVIDASMSSEHPAPLDDGIWISWTEAYAHPQYRYGFDSPQSLMRWFGDVIDDLIDCGYVIAQYNVNAGHVRVGGRQVAFNYDVAELVSLDDTLDCLNI